MNTFRCHNFVFFVSLSCQTHKPNPMKHLLLLFALLPTLLFAQQEDETKYLTGAVPLVNEKVVFTKRISNPNLSKEQMFTMALDWATKTFVTKDEDKNKVSFSNPDNGQIVCYGDQILVLKKSTLALDRTRMGYTMDIKCSAGICETKITNITYLYDVSYQKAPIRYEAETWIADEYSISKNKLMRGTKLFRIKTVDLVNELFTGLESQLGAAKNSTPVTPTAVAAAPVVNPTETIQSSIPSDMTGYRKINADKLPGNIIKMLTDDWMLITAGDDKKFNMMTASWGGLGRLYNKPVAICFIAPTRYTYQLMESNDTYTITFYTEAYRDALNACGSKSGKDTDKVKESGLTPITTPKGSKAFAEAWLIIECRKMVSQPILHDGINDPELKKNWDGKPMHKMFIGEIMNVYVK